MKITEILMAEHSVFHNLFDHIETAVPRIKTLAEVKSLAAVVDKLMAPHSKTEDDLFIEPLEHCFEQIGQNETFHAEHRQIEDMLASVQRPPKRSRTQKRSCSAPSARRANISTRKNASCSRWPSGC